MQKKTGPRKRISSAQLHRQEIEKLRLEFDAKIRALTDPDAPLTDADIRPDQPYCISIPGEKDRVPVTVVGRLVPEDWESGRWMSADRDILYQVSRTDLEKKPQGPRLNRYAKDIFRPDK